MDHVFSTVTLKPEKQLALAKIIDRKDKIGDEQFQAEIHKELELKDDGFSRSPEEFSKFLDFFRMPFEEVARRFPCPGIEELSKIFQLVRDSGVGGQIVFDPTIMRGMDYYTGTVFECYDVSPENRRALFGGGRYDNLVGLFTKQALSGVGFGLGDVSFQNFLETHNLLPKFEGSVDVLVTTPSPAALPVAHRLASQLRSSPELKDLKVILPLSVDGFGAQIKLALKHGARFAVMLGDDELKRGEVGLKDLRANSQTSVPQSGLAEAIAKALRS